MLENWLRLISDWQTKRVLVVGDACMDNWHRVTRVIRQDQYEAENGASVFVSNLNQMEQSGGMAVFVAECIQELGGVPEICALDAGGAKHRFFDHHDNQIVRIDYAPCPIATAHDAPGLLCRLDELESNGVKIDAAVVSDYGRGAITGQLMTRLHQFADHAGGFPIVVDPDRTRDLHWYGNVALFKCNAGQHREESDIPTIYTCGHNGAFVRLGRGVPWWRVPTQKVQRDYPIGCGDACIAVLALGLAADRDVSIVDLAGLMNVAGYLEAWPNQIPVPLRRTWPIHKNRLRHGVVHWPQDLAARAVEPAQPAT